MCGHDRFWTRVSSWRTRVFVAVTAISVTANAVGVAAAVPSSVLAAPDSGACPQLFVIGVQGAEESSPGAAANSDTGALGQVFGPLRAAAGDSVARTYVPFRETNPEDAAGYDAAVTDTAQQVETYAADLVQRCPETRIAAAGYAQGASAIAAFATDVGAGRSDVPADRVAGIALLANPSRAVGTPTIPGRPHSATPSAAPGTHGQHTTAVSFGNTRVTGGGIVAAAQAPDFGALTGRVADLCVPGDATCDTTPGGPLATTVAHLTARTDHRDPVAAISTLAAALAGTAFTTSVEMINNDLTGNSLDQLAYNPTKSLGERLAEASAPGEIPAGPDQALAALFKLGTIGLGTIVTVARTVFTPATFAELAAIGLANPAAAVAVLGTKVAAAVVELIPPQTALGWVNDAFDAVTSLVTDPADLYAVAGSASYSSTIGRHGSYRTNTTSPGMPSAFAAVAEWFTAVDRDLTTPESTSQPEPPLPQPAPTPTGPAVSENGSTPPPLRDGAP
ncbi:cutinase family protein [Nocardia carnea]|uniref:cutinase family protein n=1 Tax=Nocardia carnea TaxID=37328 RepID=UPI0024545565|nr:cutinase family protein [Nocardia carnea]